MTIPRWKVEIHCHTQATQVHYIEEFDELGHIVEGGPEFTEIKEIKITYNLADPKLRLIKGGKNEGPGNER